MKKKRLLFVLVFILLLFGAVFIVGSSKIFSSSNIKQSGKLYIPTGASYRQTADSLSKFLKNEKTFEIAARLMKLPRQIRPGRYSIEEGMSNKDVVNLLLQGKQDEVSLRIGNYMDIYELASHVSTHLECDSASIVQAITGADFTKNLKIEEMLYFFLPNTYNFYWSSTGKQFVNRMKSQFDNFWTSEKIQIAEDKNMTPLDVTILASIVQLESAHADEQPDVAGVYLNRLNRNMKLQADPTVVYAMKKARGSNEKIERVLYKDLLTPSPYNTYLHFGLPPAPICMPNPSAINAVLFPKEHDYLFFVADPSRPGYHLFSTTFGEHSRKAKVYQSWIDDVTKNRGATD